MSEMISVKVAKDCYVPKDNIRYYLAYTGKTIKNLVASKKADGSVLDMTGGRRTISVIVLKTGEAILTTISTDTLKKRYDGEKCEEEPL